VVHGTAAVAGSDVATARGVDVMFEAIVGLADEQVHVMAAVGQYLHQLRAPHTQKQFYNARAAVDILQFLISYGGHRSDANYSQHGDMWRHSSLS